MPGKVFEIGYPKNGTTSLHHAMRLLGYRTTHTLVEEGSLPIHERPAIARDLFEKWVKGRYDFDAVEQYDYIGSIFFPIYREIDEQFPNSRFILLVRDRESWLESMRTFAPEHLHVDLARPRELDLEALMRIKLLGCLYTLDEQRFIELYDEHIRQVKHHFKDTGRLLVLDICGGEGWDELCGFLGMPIPPMPFPWLNRTPARNPAGGTASGAPRLTAPLPPAAATAGTIDGPPERKRRDRSRTCTPIAACQIAGAGRMDSPACVYGESIRSNRYFRDLRMPGGVPRTGCSYCEGASGVLCPRTLVEREPELSMLLESCDGSRSGLHLDVVDLASFHDRDLLLFNRGTPGEVRDALAALRRLKSAAGSASSMSRTACRFLLFHPWQDLEGFRVNLEAIHEERVPSLLSSFEFRCMDPDPDIPLYHLASMDGLIDPASEHCWRFQNPAAGVVHEFWSAFKEHLPDQLGLLEACHEAALRAMEPEPCRENTVEQIRQLAARIAASTIPGSIDRRLLGIDSKPDSDPVRPMLAWTSLPSGAGEILEAARGLGSLGGSMVTIHGPEPMTHLFLPDLVRQLRLMGAAGIEIMTYGNSLAQPGRVSDLARWGVDLVTFLLHSSEPAVHDGFVRLEGAFEQAMAGMRKLSAGNGPRTAVAFVASAGNIHLVRQLPELAQSAGARQIRIVLPAWGLDLANAWRMTASIDEAFSTASRLGIDAGFDREHSFEWIEGS